MTNFNGVVALVITLGVTLTGGTSCQGNTRPGTPESTFVTTPTPTTYSCARYP